MDGGWLPEVEWMLKLEALTRGKGTDLSTLEDHSISDVSFKVPSGQTAFQAGVSKDILCIMGMRCQWGEVRHKSKETYHTTCPIYAFLSPKNN